MFKITTNEIVTVKALKLMVEDAIDRTANFGMSPDGDIEKSLQNLVNSFKESKENSQVKYVDEISYEKSIHNLICSISINLDLIIYKYTGFMTEDLYLCYDDDLEIKELSSYNFNLNNRNTHFEFTFNFDTEDVPFNRRAFIGSILEEYGIEFKKTKQVDETNFECVISISKENIADYARKVIDGEDLDNLISKNNRNLF